MSLAQLRRSILDLRWSVLWFGLGLALYMILIVAFWPAMRQGTQVLTQYIQQLPDALLKAFGVTDFSHFPGFIGAEVLNFMWPLIAAVFVVMAASAAVGGEMDSGTIELWLSVPAPRWRLLSAKLVALLVGILALVLASIVALGVGARLVDETLATSSLLATAIVLTAFCVALGGYTALFSAVFAQRGKAAGLAAAVTIASYLASVIAGISKDWDWLRYASLMTAYHPQQSLSDGRIEPGEVAALLAIGVACALLSLVVFERRDANP